MIYTSSFDYARNHSRVLSGDLRIMSIALEHPDWLQQDGRIIYPFRPAPHIVRYYREQTLSARGFDKYYRDQVLRYIENPRKLVSSIESDYGCDVVLCCWEPAGEFCHRQVVRNWIAEKTGVLVTELDADEPVPAPNLVQPAPVVEGEQISLF